MKVTELSDGRFRLCTGRWSETITRAQLSGRLKLYQSLRDRKGGQYAAFYQGAVQALTELAEGGEE